MAARRNRRRRRRNRGRFGGLYKLLSVLLICAAIAAGCIVFFRVNVIVVEGNVRYTSEEIISVTGVQQGDNLITLNRYQLANDIYRELPYISAARVYRRLPDTLIIEVTESAAVAAIQKDGEWWLLDAQCKLLERGDSSIAQGIAEVRELTPLAPAPGTPLAVAEESKSKLDSLTQLLSALYQQGLSGQVTDFIDLTASNEIRFGFGDKLTVVMPMSGDFASKAFALQRVLEAYAEQQVELTGTLDLTYGEQEAHVLPDRWTPESAASTTAPETTDTTAQTAPEEEQGEANDENA